MLHSRHGYAALVLAVLAGCGGSGSSSDPAGTGFLSLGLTDAAVDSVQEIRLYVTGITVKRENGPPEALEVALTDCAAVPGETASCNPLDLLSLQDGIVLSLLDSQAMIAGRYQWLRIEIDESRSYIVEDDGGITDLRIPSARGLQLSSGFVVLADRTTDLVLDWDTRQGLVDPVGQDLKFLKPTIRVIDMAEYGAIAGSVDAALPMGDCANEADTGDGNVVYVFEGDVTPDDIDNNAPNPLVTAPVRQQDDGSYAYSVEYLPLGSYTVAFTCQGLNDTVPEDDVDTAAGNEDIEFVNPQMATIVAGQVQQIDF